MNIGTFLHLFFVLFEVGLIMVKWMKVSLILVKWKKMKSKILIKWNWVGNKKWNGGKVLKGAFLSYSYWKYQDARFTPTKAEKLIFAHFLCKWDPRKCSIYFIIRCRPAPVNKTDIYMQVPFLHASTKVCAWKIKS